MPISRKDFEKGLDARTKKVIDLLESRPNEAYSSDEIAEKLGMDHIEVIRMLNYLYFDLNAIERRVIAKKYYYARLTE